MKLGIIGGGVVGRANARAFIEHVSEVCVYDTDATRRTHSLQEAMSCDLIFVCLPTPQRVPSLECNTVFLEDFFASCAGSRANLVLRSTVPVGFTRKMREKHDLPNLCHSPEFLTARCSLVDAQMPSRNVIGGNSVSASLLQELYIKRFPHVPLFVMSSDESEAVKLFCNSFFAVKIGVFNELYQFAAAKKLNWQRIHEAMMADGRICPSHTLVPGPSGKTGFGGACLPKDLANLITCVQEENQLPYITMAAHVRNQIDVRS